MSKMDLSTKKKLTILGINSGTSMDGLDFSLVRFAATSKSEFSARTLKEGYAKFPTQLRKALLELADSNSTSLDTLTLADEALGEFIGRRAVSFLKICSKSGFRADAIASHGQTVRHLPAKHTLATIRVNGTLQIGAPERIAVKTGLPVVSHFRNAHTALAGEGAPITTTAVHRLLTAKSESRLIVNIGGMSNYFWLPPNGKAGDVRSADIGVGNALLDLAAHELFDINFDRGGKLASAGKPSQRLITLISAKNFFEMLGSSEGTVSTGREKYSPAALQKILQLAQSLELSKNDLLATLNEFTAIQIASAIKKLIGGHRQTIGIYVTGGGVHNRLLMHRLREMLTPKPIAPLTQLGWNPDFLESASYATLGYMRLKEIPSISPSKNFAPIFGRVCLPPLPVKPRR